MYEKTRKYYYKSEFIFHIFYLLLIFFIYYENYFPNFLSKLERNKFSTNFNVNF